MITISGVTKSFGAHVVLRHIDLTIQPGEIFGIIGKSGAGKSTLLRCINLLEQPDQGKLWIDNQEITGLNHHHLRQARHKTAMIFQQFNLLNSKTVYDNIALPMRIQGQNETEIRQKIEELLPVVGLSEKINAYPADLSGGQKQRVAIARALSTSPKILLCDEATSALDPQTTESILLLLKDINQRYGITIVLITHEMDVIKRICQRVAVMEAGCIQETLTLAEALQQKDSLARNMLYAQITPSLPDCLRARLTSTTNHHPLVRLCFEGQGATVPFISQTSRELGIDINILLANIDSIDTITCGVLIAELNATPDLLEAFKQRCQQSNLTMETLGYVNGA